jgi:hypothetical protein
MQQRDRVKLLKRVRRLVAGRSLAVLEPRAAFRLPRPRPANVDALALLDVAEVDRVDPPPLVRDDGRLHVADQRPLRGAEEGVTLDVGGARARAKAPVFVLDEELTDEGFAGTFWKKKKKVSYGGGDGQGEDGKKTDFDICGAPA